jgi:hypothetical protein
MYVWNGSNCGQHSLQVRVRKAGREKGLCIRQRSVERDLPQAANKHVQVHRLTRGNLY